jgi:hypothetical protein
MWWLAEIALYGLGAVVALFYLLVALGVSIAARIRAARTPEPATPPMGTEDNRHPMSPQLRLPRSILAKLHARSAGVVRSEPTASAERRH